MMIAPEPSYIVMIKLSFYYSEATEFFVQYDACSRCGEIPCPCLECREPVSEEIECFDTNMAENEKRFKLYKLCTTILFGYLGKNNRVALPKCVVLEIRSMYPSNDGSYVRFQDSNVSE